MRFDNNQIIFSSTVGTGDDVFSKEIDMTTGTGICFQVEKINGVGSAQVFFEATNNRENVNGWVEIPDTQSEIGTAYEVLLYNSKSKINYDYIRFHAIGSSGSIKIECRYSLNGF